MPPEPFFFDIEVDILHEPPTESVFIGVLRIVWISWVSPLISMKAFERSLPTNESGIVLSCRNSKTMLNIKHQGLGNEVSGGFETGKEMTKSQNANGTPLIQVLDHAVLAKGAGKEATWLPIPQVSLDPEAKESSIQVILDENPSILPVSDFWGDSEVVSLGRELKVVSGKIDNLYLTRSGRLVLVEAKLYRNSEARRKVVAQALDYAVALSRLDYDGIEAILRRNKKLVGKETLLSFYKKAFTTETTRPSDRELNGFQDRFTRYLRDGDFLILIVGDGIQTSAIELAGALARHPTLRYDMGLVSLDEFRSSTHRLLVPKLHTRTEVITRNHTKITWEGQGNLYFQMLTAEEEERAKFDNFIYNLLNASEESTAFAKDLHRKVLDSKLTVNFVGKDNQYWDVCYGGITLWRNTRAVGGSISMSQDESLGALAGILGAKAFSSYLNAFTVFNPKLKVVNGKKLNHHIAYQDILGRQDEFWAIINSVIAKLPSSDTVEEEADENLSS